jgi:hypothetical protein
MGTTAAPSDDDRWQLAADPERASAAGDEPLDSDDRAAAIAALQAQLEHMQQAIAGLVEDVARLLATMPGLTQVERAIEEKLAARSAEEDTRLATLDDLVRRLETVARAVRAADRRPRPLRADD